MEKKRKEPPLERREYHSPSTGIFFNVKSSLYKDKSVYQTIEVFDNEYFGRVLLLDGLVQTTERDEFFYHETLAHPPLVVHPDPKDCLIIGGGDGGLLKEILRYPILRVLMLEIDPVVIDVSKMYFPWLEPAMQDRRVKLIIRDGGDYLKQEEKKFDIIYIDSSEPVGPSLSLNEKNFYLDLKNSLNENGIAAVQVGSPFYHSAFIKEKALCLREIFKIVKFYTAPAPTYPGGCWSFAFLSDGTFPSEIKRDPPPDLNYYDLEIHEAAFALPKFMKDLIKNDAE
jgi:spermidine synthase